MKKQVSVDDGKIVLHRVCTNSGMDSAEVSSLKKEVEMLKERLEKNEAKGKGVICCRVNLAVTFAVVFIIFFIIKKLN